MHNVCVCIKKKWLVERVAKKCFHKNDNIKSWTIDIVNSGL